MHNHFYNKVVDAKLESNERLCHLMIKKHKESVHRFLELNMGIQIEYRPRVEYQKQKDNLYHLLTEEFNDFDIYEYFKLLEISPRLEAMDLNYREFELLKIQMIDFIKRQNRKYEQIIARINEKLLEKNRQSINEVFGFYRYFQDSGKRKSIPDKIVINLLSCEFFAANNHISLEDLVLSTYVHELTHYYSHVGFDKDKLSWTNYHEIDDFVKEGIAQYYAYQYFKSIGKVESFDQIENLTDSLGSYFFGDEYREYLKYLSYTPEQMYFAFIQFRRNNCTKPKEFLQFLDKSKKELP